MCMTGWKGVQQKDRKVSLDSDKWNNLCDIITNTGNLRSPNWNKEDPELLPSTLVLRDYWKSWPTLQLS